MIIEPEFQPIEQYFLAEASELLQIIEQTLLSLLEEKNVEKVHTLMRSAHTIKGSAANCELKTIETIAHHLEDVFQALYPAELEIDPELGSLLLDGYECLHAPLSATLSGLPYDEPAILDRTASVFAQLQTKLGDFFGREAPLPTSEELGFDVVGLIFADSVPQDLQQLEEAIATQDAQQIEPTLRTKAEFFVELGVSYSLPGLEQIAQASLRALLAAPDQVLQIAQAALENFQQAYDMVMAGDRTQGGVVSEQLRHWASTAETDVYLPELAATQVEAIIVSEEELPFITTAIEQESKVAQIDRDVDLLTSSLSELSEPFVADFTDSLFISDSLEDEVIVSLSEQVEDLSEAIIETDEVAAADSNLVQESGATSSNSESELLVPLFSESTAPLVTVPNEPNVGSSLAATSQVDRILHSIWTGELASQPQATHSPPPSHKTQPTAAPPSIRVAVEQIERLSHIVGELLINENQQNLQSDQIHHFAHDAFQQFLRCQQQLSQIRDWSDKNLLNGDRQRRQLKPSSQEGSYHPAADVNETHSEFDVLEMDAYSDLHLLLQALTEHMMQLGERIEGLEGFVQQYRFNLGKRKQLLSGAQEELLQARMVPLETVLNRFPRLLQQMVAAHHKSAELKMTGTKVLVDKVIAEKLYEPLLHIIRNAYDHGLEPADVRRQEGKPEAGQITIHAYHQGNRTTLEIQDDGQGLNWDRIRAKAIENHVLTPAQAANASETELAEVLFEPGFSTAEKVSELSGRGIGLDVVRSQLQAVQVTFSVRSVSGQGTTFVLQLPHSLTTSRLLVCESQGVVYAFLSEAIGQVLLPQPDQIHSQQSMTEAGMQTFLRWEEKSSQQLIPIYPLNDILNYQYPLFLYEKSANLSLFPVKAKNRAKPLLLLESGGQRVCLQVDQILVEQELVIKSLGNTLILPSYIQGYSVLGDGSLTLIIDPVELVTQAGGVNSKTISGSPKLPALLPAVKSTSNFEEAQLARATTEPKVTRSLNPSEDSSGFIGRHSKVLVVDDSVVQRQSLVRTFTKDGYQVLQAGNGQDALAQLNQHPDIQFVICDIEMPHMNGFEFLSHWRQDSRFAQIPIMMLTTRSSQKHRQLALALGARAYFTKPYSDQQLLETVTKIVNQPQQPVTASVEI